MVILLLLLFFFSGSVFSSPVHLIDRQSRVVDILHELTQCEGPYIFTCLKEWRGRPIICKVDCIGKSYIVRFNESDYKPARIEEVFIHQIARKIGFGPDVIYANYDEGIIIMEYFGPPQREQVSMNKEMQIDMLLDCIKKIHEIKIECRPRGSFTSSILNRFIYSPVVVSNAYDLDLVHFKEVLKFFEQCIDQTVNLVLVHGDLHRLNIFLCGDTYKVIDFETVHYDHPYVDLAHVAIFFGFGEKEQAYLLERYLNRQPTAHDWVQFTIFKAFVLAKWALWMLETLPDDFVKTKEYKEMFYVKPLFQFFDDSIQERNPAWRYHAAITALKEAEKLFAFLQGQLC